MVATVEAVSNAHFVGLPVFTTVGTAVFASGKVAGLGDVTTIHVVLSGDAQCINPGGNKPSAGNKQSFAAARDVPVQNGKALFSLGADADFQPDCAPPMSVVWSNVLVTVSADDGTFISFP
jgi:hypothetical protein